MEYVLGVLMYSPCIIYQLILMRRYLKKGKQSPVIYFIWVNIFLLYLYMIFEVTGIGTLGELIINGAKYMSRSNFIPLDSVGISFFLNIIMFMPFGFLVPFIWKEYRKIGKTAAAGAMFSIIIEVSQLFNYRVTDIDDLITNTFGTIIGYFVWKTFVQVFGLHLKTENKSKWEPIIYVVLAVTGMFIFL